MHPQKELMNYLPGMIIYDLEIKKNADFINFGFMWKRMWIM
jgi:hypothetical protein